MKTVTIRGLDADLLENLKRTAAKQQKSLNQFAGPVGQSGIHHKGKIGPIHVVTGRQGDGSRHPLPSPFWILGHGQPLTFFK